VSGPHAPRRDLTIRVLRQVDLTAADRLRKQAGFNQTRQDWERLLAFEPTGCFQAHAGGRLLGTVTTTVFDQGLAWIGMVLVDHSARGSGIGSLLVDHAIRYLETERGVACIGLDATPAGASIYHRRNFSAMYGLSRWEGVAAPSAPHHNVRSMTRQDLPAMARLDRSAFGADRKDILSALFYSPSARCVVIEHGGETVGFAMARPGAQRWHIGPVIATGTAIADTLVNATLSQLAGKPVEIDIPDPLGPSLTASYKLRPVRPFTRMLRGIPPQPIAQGLVQLPVGPELG